MVRAESGKILTDTHIPEPAIPTPIRHTLEQLLRDEQGGAVPTGQGGFRAATRARPDHAGSSPAELHRLGPATRSERQVWAHLRLEELRAHPVSDHYLDFAIDGELRPRHRDQVADAVRAESHTDEVQYQLREEADDCAVSELLDHQLPRVHVHPQG